MVFADANGAVKSVDFEGNVSSLQSSVSWQGPYGFDIADYTGIALGDPDNGFAWLPFVGPSLEPGSLVIRLVMDITEAFPTGTTTLRVRLGELPPDGGYGATWDLQDGDIESIVQFGVRSGMPASEQGRIGPIVDTIASGGIAGIFLNDNSTGAALVEEAGTSWWIECSQWGGGLLPQPPEAADLTTGHGRIWVEVATPIAPS